MFCTLSPFARSLALTLSFALAACAGTQKESAKPVAAAPTASGNAECDHFADGLCNALGEETEPCASMRTMREWLPAAACTAASADMPNVLARVSELRKSCDTLTTRLCTDLGEDSDACASVKQDMPRVPAGHCNTLLSHYPELVAQMRERAAHDKPLPDETWNELLAGSAPSFGPADAKVKIVEFSDFQCPYCSQAAATVKQIRTTYGDKVRFVFRQFPLSFHDHARLAAQAALAAHAQNKFWDMHDKLFEHQAALERPDLERYAKDSGVDLAAFKKAIDDVATNAIIDADLTLGRKVGVDGTPTMFIDGKRVENPTDYESVAPLIDAALVK